MDRFYRFCIRFIEISAFILFGILAVCSFFRTASIKDAYQIEILLTWDNPLLNLLFLILFTAVLWGMAALFSRIPDKRFRRNADKTIHGEDVLLVLTCIWVFCASLLWSYFSKSGPASDCGSVYYAAKQFARNDFSAVAFRDSYFSVYPFQLGLAFFYEMIFRIAGNDNFHILQGVNALCLVVCVLSQYHLCRYFFKNKAIQINCLLLTGFCLPFIMYGSYIYGEIPSFAFLLFGSWMLTAYLEKKSFFYYIAAFLSIVCSVLVRKNTLIFLIALGIILMLWLVEQRKLFSRKKLAGFFLSFALMFFAAVMSLPAIQAFYGLRADSEINPGVPASTYLAMGLMESEAGPGHYSGYNFDTFTVAADYDTETASDIGMSALRERLSYFVSHPLYAADFLSIKFLNQWLNAGWAVFSSTYVSFGERLPVIESCFSGSLYPVLVSYMSGYQMTLYFFAAIGALSLLRTKPEDKPVFSGVFLLTAVGGALFYLFWESSGRYVLPYAVFVLPNAACGMNALAVYLKEILRKKRKGDSFV